MKCASCNVEISKEFKVAISRNLCPACGNAIIPSGNLASFVPLCDLILAQLPTIMEEQQSTTELAEKLAMLIITNFNVMDKSAKRNPSKEKGATIEVSEDDVTEIITEDGIKLEKIDSKKAKNMLQKMRDDALSGALEDRGFTIDGDQVLLSEDPIANAQLLELKQNQDEARQKILSGSGGFRRS